MILKNSVLILLLLLFSVGQVMADPATAEKYRPSIDKKTYLLPYDDWTKEYTNYFKRHYKDSSLVLNPVAIVMHYTASSSFSSAYNTFYNGGYYDDGDVGTVFGHLSVHYIVDKDGKIYQLLPCNRRCRGAYGVNHVAISIEMVASGESDLLANDTQILASCKLVKFLKTYFDIPEENIWGHYEVGQGKYSKNKAVRYYYTDYGDSKSPNSYPPAFGRSDPGSTYMGILRKYLSK